MPQTFMQPSSIAMSVGTKPATDLIIIVRYVEKMTIKATRLLQYVLVSARHQIFKMILGLWCIYFTVLSFSYLYVVVNDQISVLMGI